MLDGMIYLSVSSADISLIIINEFYFLLDGSTPTSLRQSLVDRFQKEETMFLFLISTKAGGLGLNLTAANKVIVFDGKIKHVTLCIPLSHYASMVSF